MRITKDVVIDLWPLYLSGEASPDSRVLVEEFLSQNPDFEREIRQEAVLPNPVPLPATHGTEMRSLARTKRTLRRQRLLLSLAVTFTCWPLAFKFDSHGVQWFWQDAPQVAMICIAAAIGFWIQLFVLRRRLRVVGL